MALAGAIAAMAQDRHNSILPRDVFSPETPPPRSTSAALIVPTCEILEDDTVTVLGCDNPLATATYTQVDPLPSAHRLVGLLSKLPYELRLNIYEYCIPCMWHRKRKILLDYIVDCKWMATSPLIFNEAAPLALAGPTPFVYTRLAERETLTDIFSKYLDRAFPNDCSWTLPAARSMIEKLAVTVQCPFSIFYRHGDAKDDFAKCLLAFFVSVSEFPNLETLYISLGLDCFPGTSGPNQHFANDWGGEIEEFILQKLEVSALTLKTSIPMTCRVVWRFDKAAMPHVVGSLADKSEQRLIYLNGIHEAMENYWGSVCSTATMVNSTALTQIC